MTLEEQVDAYIKLRDQCAKRKEVHKTEIKKYEELLEQLEASMKAQLDAMGVESARTNAGTAYKTTKTGANVGDWDALLNHVRENAEWAMLERRVSKAAVKEYMDAHDGQLPPGVTWYAEQVVNVKR